MRAPPRAAELVADFANTLDVHAGTDTLSTPDELAAWLTDHDLPPAGTPGPALHAAAVALRAGIREHLGTHVGDTPDRAVTAAADAALTRFPVHIAADGTLTPAPGLTPAERAVAELAVAWSTLTITGDAARLKRCAEHTCHEVFWDTSKNRSKRWCSMQGCGNRAKARSYAARRAAASG
ncbi:CGNR zinc finger domain-containing protein [Streptomyces sp. WMMC500]|uniref:CGNR zinc finger domain-containing protein n=1 Tax=Streptomyces sp. WMMC500 TaxID=3015154 RepID=UPI00248C7142|nr:CGNR zinc finger domain-containing protein [Streptomyces sp. WMMC500]WBB59182.1 CGNR zinc finger domain-containing protein [Streptomyces sp. WMMC500]